jgi:UDP-2,3-diacylglucosamine hydrolase
MSSLPVVAPLHASPLGIIAGGGGLPKQLILRCAEEGRGVFVVAVEGETDATTIEHVPHIWARLGAVGNAVEHLRQAGVHDLVFAGKIGRPSLSSLKPDALGAKLMAKLGLSLLGGDSAIFKTIIAFFESQGFRIVGMSDVMRGMVAPKGAIGKHMPGVQALEDISHGVRVAHAIGAMDIGQAVIIKHGLVLGVEAAEGTDRLIERCALLAGEGKGGVLIKACKPVQEKRVDLPTIGKRTVELVHRAGFAGIAVEAGHSLLAERAETIRMADELGVFLFGFTKDT